MLAKLYAIVKEAIGTKLGKTYLWSDSTIVLCWIRLEPHLLKTFIVNRVTKIQNLTADAKWFHVPSSDNPADILSRGITVDELIGNELWWHGPSWIDEKKRWPQQDVTRETNTPELKTVTGITVQTDHGMIGKYSSYDELRRIVAYCLCFRRDTKGERVIGPVTAAKFEKSERALVKMVQHQEFSKELLDLQEGRELVKGRKLTAF